MIKFKNELIQKYWDSFYISNILMNKIKLNCCYSSNSDKDIKYLEYCVNKYTIMMCENNNTVNSVVIYNRQMCIFSGFPDEKFCDILNSI